MSITANIRELQAKLPPQTRLVAVSKYKPNEDIQTAYDAGQRMFGESRVQELVAKHEALPADIEWHFIGHLQKNKVKYLAPFVQLIHGVDSLQLLQQIDKEGKKNGRIIDCLLQFHIAQEETKFGLSLEEAHELLASSAFGELKHTRICGVMGMASYTDNQPQVQAEFAQLRSIFQQLQVEFFGTEPSFKEISMGMSGDYELAIAQGSTLIRVGSALFGSR